MNGVPCLQWRGWVNKGSVPPLDSPVTAGRIKIQNYPGSTGVVSHRIRLSKAELLGISWVIYPTQRTVSDPYNWYILSIYVYKILSPFILKYRKLRFDVRTIFREYGEPVPWIMRTGTPWDSPVYRADVYVNNSHVHWLPRRDDRNSSHVEWISPAHFTFAFGYSQWHLYTDKGRSNTRCYRWIYQALWMLFETNVSLSYDVTISNSEHVLIDSHRRCGI